MHTDTRKHPTKTSLDTHSPTTRYALHDGRPGADARTERERGAAGRAEGAPARLWVSTHASKKS